MVGHKRGREGPSVEGASGGLAGSSKGGRGGAGVKLVFECTICGKACSKSSNLTAHMRTHSGERPYACTTCGMAFSQNGSLAIHMRVHSGDRPYACTTCGMAFSQPHHLTRHCEKVHALDQE